ncbi:MAG: efflux RND transporter permease subunit [Selenomonadaceae bacterium]|nr:efflux RND transporter permease subunit [Selenomonadaceae bacterium]
MRNLTKLSLTNRDLVWYFIVVVFVGGIFFYQRLGRMEDPEFTIREMIISAAWPGATAQQIQEQVTDKLEQTLQDTPALDYIESYSRPGVTVIFVELRDDADIDNIKQTWLKIRNYCEDIKGDLPEGVLGPFYDDRFDDVYGTIYALVGDDFSYEELRAEAQKIRRQLLGLKEVQRVELEGEQTEKIYVEIKRDKLSELGIAPTAIADAIEQANQMMPSGMLETTTDNVYIRVSGMFDDLHTLESLPINADGKIFRLADIATIERRYSQPSEPKFFYNGQPAIGIAVSMTPGGNILELGEEEHRLIEAAQSELPLGMEIHQVADQPQVVEESIGEFVEALVEAIVIVMVINFISLGWRTGLVVAFCIPLVFAGTFCAMYLMGIDLQKVSLGSLIIALGLLVDDEIIAVEMMSVQLERGLDRLDAACSAFDITAKPMLTGTLITCAGFIPIAFSKGMAAEFCSSLFPVICSTLLLSWIVSVMVTPLFGLHLIKVSSKPAELYQGRFYQMFRAVLKKFLAHRVIVLLSTVAVFVGSIVLMDFVEEEFFPSSIRPEVLVNLSLPEGSSMVATEEATRTFSTFLDKQGDLIKNYSAYVGVGAPRFVLTMEPELDADNFAQFVIVAESREKREELTARINDELSTELSHVRSKIHFIQTGPPAAYPIMLRVSGYDVERVRTLAMQVRDVVADDPNVFDAHLNWIDKSKVLHVELDQDKLSALGLSTTAVAQTLYTELTGAKAAEFYTGDRTLDIDLRLSAIDRDKLSDVENMPIYLGAAGYVPLSQVATLEYRAEDGLIWRRNLKPTITVQANIRSGTAVDAGTKAMNALESIIGELPYGYAIEAGGDLEDSDSSLDNLSEPLPLMLFVIATLLMIQLRSAKQLLLTVLTIPLGLIGVTFGMLLTGSPLGFVAYLGILALSGMISRNSVILLDQIDKHLAEGLTPHEAVIESTVMRFRPIMLTALTAILGMIPLMASVFWGPMAIAIASGLLAATVLTLLVLPTMYAMMYGVKG